MTKFDNVEQMYFFMKMEGQKANQTFFLKLDPQETIKSCLKKKKIIEFPTIHVALADQLSQFPLEPPPLPAKQPSSLKRSATSVSEESALSSLGALYGSVDDHPDEEEVETKTIASKQEAEDEMEEGELDEDDQLFVPGTEAENPLNLELIQTLEATLSKDVTNYQQNFG